MSVENFKGLIVWQKSMNFVAGIYEVTKSFPSDERFGLTAQIRRAAVSVPSNIAEGNSRISTAEYRQFLSVARGSLAEVETQLLISQMLGFANESDIESLFALKLEIHKMLCSIINKLVT
ncbi:MAG: four helix bundle protein [Planctomycetes bacterium]|nr:four helix bundle protein [Planctomycetota bacterium]